MQVERFHALIRAEKVEAAVPVGFGTWRFGRAWLAIVGGGAVNLVGRSRSGELSVASQFGRLIRRTWCAPYSTERTPRCRLTITGAQRNLLFKPTLDYLSVADDAYVAAINGRFDEADRLGRQTCEELLFLLLDLRWRERQTDEVISLSTPPAIVRRVVKRIMDGAVHEVFEGTRAEILKLESDATKLCRACEEILAQLPDGEGSA